MTNSALYRRTTSGMLLAGLLLAPSFTVSVSAARSEVATKTGTNIVAWGDIAGRQYSLASTANTEATVFLFVSTQCPVSNLYTPRMLELSRDYKSRGVRFFLVDSNADDDLARVRRYSKERNIPFPVVKDRGAALADTLGAQSTPEAIACNSKGAIVYMGRIDDNIDRARITRNDLREALDAILSGRPVQRSRTMPFGCAIFRDKSIVEPSRHKGDVTYTRDVAKILNTNCVICHRTGEVGPFSLETYREARAWAKPIEEYTARHLMPPWKPVGSGDTFHDSRSLSVRQIELLARWADSGALQGDPKVLPAAPVFPPSASWTLGKPDLVLAPVRPYHLEAEGKDVYRNYVLPIDFKEDRYVTATEFHPGNRAIVHHIVTYLDATGKSSEMDGKETEPGYSVSGTIGIGVDTAEWGDVWVPGNAPRFLPPGVALKIAAGTRIVMQVHYHKTGKPEVDHSQMALYFAKGKIDSEMHTLTAGSVTFVLKPGKELQQVHGELPWPGGALPFNARLQSIFPHMHMLGREMKVVATFPDGTRTTLIWINDWDFSWQATYFYKEPITLPKGTHVDVYSTYDNSEQNPRQTAQPPQIVHFGEQTTDEMCFVFLGLSVNYAQPGN